LIISKKNKYKLILINVYENGTFMKSIDMYVYMDAICSRVLKIDRQDNIKINKF